MCIDDQLTDDFCASSIEFSTSSSWGFFTCASLDFLFAEFVDRAVEVLHTSSSTKHKLNNGVQAMLELLTQRELHNLVSDILHKCNFLLLIITFHLLCSNQRLLFVFAPSFVSLHLLHQPTGTDFEIFLSFPSPPPKNLITYNLTYSFKVHVNSNYPHYLAIYSGYICCWTKRHHSSNTRNFTKLCIYLKTEA